jgi:hypothetical protein
MRNWIAPVLGLYLVVAASIESDAQREILSTKLGEYGIDMKFVQAWTDDEFIIMLVRGRMNNSMGHMFFLIHPEKGIVSKHVLEKTMFVTPYKNIAVTSDEITVFYQVMKKDITYHSLSFSKSSYQPIDQIITDEIKDTEKETLFSFLKDGQLLFGSISKDRKKIAFREMMKDGSDKIRYLFDVPEYYNKYLKSGSIGNLYGYNNTLKVVRKNTSGQYLTLDVLDFDLTTQKIKINSFVPENTAGSIDAAFLGNDLFILKTEFNVVRSKSEFKLYLEVLEYPSLKSKKLFVCSHEDAVIPFKTSHFNTVSFKTGLYFSGRNRNFSDEEEEGLDVRKTLRALSKGYAFIHVSKTQEDKILLTVGSYKEIFLTNTTSTTISYFFGCLDSNFESSQSNQKSSAEKLNDYLKTIQEEKPALAEIGYSRTFGIFVTKNKFNDDVTIKEF